MNQRSKCKDLKYTNSRRKHVNYSITREVKTQMTTRKKIFAILLKYKTNISNIQKKF